jgi:hypothetical protein
MADEKKPDAGNAEPNAHTAETVKIDSNTVREFIKRSALSGAHDWSGPDERGYFKCKHCGRKESSLPEDVLKSECHPQPATS